MLLIAVVCPFHVAVQVISDDNVEPASDIHTPFEMLHVVNQQSGRRHQYLCNLMPLCLVVLICLHVGRSERWGGGSEVRYVELPQHHYYRRVFGHILQLSEVPGTIGLNCLPQRPSQLVIMYAKIHTQAVHVYV